MAEFIFQVEKVSSPGAVTSLVIANFHLPKNTRFCQNVFTCHTSSELQQCNKEEKSCGVCTWQLIHHPHACHRLPNGIHSLSVGCMVRLPKPVWLTRRKGYLRILQPTRDRWLLAPFGYRYTSWVLSTTFCTRSRWAYSVMLRTPSAVCLELQSSHSKKWLPQISRPYSPSSWYFGESTQHEVAVRTISITKVIWDAPSFGSISNNILNE